jgi:hypothetical protein
MKIWLAKALTFVLLVAAVISLFESPLGRTIGWGFSAWVLREWIDEQEALPPKESKS